MKVERADPVSGPSSSIGIMRFFDSDSKTVKLDPRAVLAAILVFGVIILILQRI